ncbi:MAG: hypothetical protein JNM31_12705 [Flavobacteriales bacterium]|nr:hypothetical protein [Flavobacteriales bacterium]
MSVSANAQTGTTCATAVPVSPGTHTAPADNYWYLFTPAVSMPYTIRTCGLSTCDTKVWVYDYCTGLAVNEQGLNTVAYNDDACGLQSSVQVSMLAGTTYYIRMGDYQDECVNAGQLVTWEFFSATAPPPVTCAPNEVAVTVVIVPDAYPNEIAWTLQTGSGTLLASGGPTSANVCVDTTECVIFIITDTYGDGIFAPGGYWVYYDNVLMGTGYNYGSMARLDMACPPGFSCQTGLPIAEGSHAAPQADTWYEFTPLQNGVYLITTCGTNTCDTRVWVYDHCGNLVFDDTNIGTIYFDDNNGGCGFQAQVNALLEGGETYWVRIGDSNDDCAGGPINWDLTYMGPISGCTDPTMCNYQPLATVDDGSCIAWGSPDCPGGPDLIVLENVLQTSLQVSSLTVSTSDCYISEGCLTGFGVRELIRFTTHIKNIGSTDYYIGSPSANPDQFEWSPCHNHWHYAGYAEYLLYDTASQLIMQGYKNGFCVMDLECSGGGTATYGCSNMGISMGCGDIYGSGLACQWIDVTEVPNGTYTLVLRVNWDGSPDAVGRYETDMMNNWAQACIQIDRAPGLTVALDTDCSPFVDCLGNIYGSAQYDCEGVCDGSALVGDLDVDIDQDQVDAAAYVSGILDATLAALPCTDANGDGAITVTDAAMISQCGIAHVSGSSSQVDTYCHFPALAIQNVYDSVYFTLANLNMAAGYLDIHMRNPNKRVLGVELVLSGLEITGVDALTDPGDYPVTPAFLMNGNKIVCLSYEDSTIARTNTYKPLFRVHFTNPGSLLCIAQVVDVVNEDLHNPLIFLEDPCALVSGLFNLGGQDLVQVHPNPFSDRTVITFANGLPVDFELFDIQGRRLREELNLTHGRFELDRRDLAPGSYLFRLSRAVNCTGRLVIED